MRKRAWDRPDTRLIGTATPELPFASSGGNTTTPGTHPCEAALALRPCPGAPPHGLGREIVGHIPNVRQQAVAAISGNLSVRDLSATGLEPSLDLACRQGRCVTGSIIMGPPNLRWADGPLSENAPLTS